MKRTIAAIALFSACSIALAATGGLNAANPQVPMGPDPLVTINAELAALKQKVAGLETALAAAKATSDANAQQIVVMNAALAKLANHTHNVETSMDWTVTKVKDEYNQDKQVVIPGPTFGNPKGSTSGPK